ncbi:unnamed protein product [Ectocarpus sp. 6 AP-2014]
MPGRSQEELGKPVSGHRWVSYRTRARASYCSLVRAGQRDRKRHCEVYLELFTMGFCHGGCVHPHVRNNCKIGIFTRGVVQSAKVRKSYINATMGGKSVAYLLVKRGFFFLCSFLAIGNLGNTVAAAVTATSRGKWGS